MKRGFKLAFIIQSLILIILLCYNANAANETCVNYHHKECKDNNVWWFDSCNNAHLVAQYCGWSQECIDSQCINKCGNGKCEGDETCSACSQDCKCADYERCWLNKCETYCGNGRCDGNENCWSCTSDCGCRSNEMCTAGKCTTYCGNGNCDSDENCMGCTSDCRCGESQECSPGSARAGRNGCVDKCGNGQREIGEDCSSCPADAGCTTGLYCYNSQCVDCLKDEHCSTRDTPTGVFICSSDFKSTLEKVVRKAGVCLNHQCSGEDIETTRPGKTCGNSLCQEGHCGCDDGYQACLKIGKCEKVGALSDGSNCGCYSQCSSNYCSKEGKCMQALNTPISSASSLIKAGESTKVTISADNSLDVMIPTKLTLNIDTGAIMSGVIGGADCSGNQCTSGSINIQPKSRESVTIDVTGQSAGRVKFTAVITAVIDGEEYPITREEFITIINPNDGQCTEGETSQNACRDCPCPEDTVFYTFECREDNSCKRHVGWWVFVAVGGFVLLSVLIYFGYNKGRDAYIRLKKEIMLRKELKEKAEAEKAKAEDEERKKVVKALYAMKIKWENPPSIDDVLKKIKVKADEELIHEEYLDLMERMTKTKHLKEAGKILPKEEKEIRQKFCTKCGAILKSNVKFCTKCGVHTKGA